MLQQSYAKRGENPQTEDLAALAERGRKLHSEAVFEGCVRLLRFLRISSGAKSPQLGAGACKLAGR